MADNTAINLLNALNNSATYDAAKFGGNVKSSKLGGLLDIILPAYQAAFPNAPAARLANGARQAWNLHQYNQLMQQQAAAAAQRQADTDANNAANYEAATGIKRTGPMDTTFAASTIPYVRKGNGNLALNRMTHGQDLALDVYSDVDPSVVNNYTEAQGKAVNFLNRNAGLSAIMNGQNASLQRQAINNFTTGNKGGVIGVPSLDPGGAPILNASASVAMPGKTIDMYSSPYLYQSDVPTNVAGLTKAGLDDVQAKATLDETTRSHKANEAQQQAELRERVKHGYWPPRSSGSGNPFGPLNSQQNYYQGQIETIDKRLKQLGYIDETGMLKPVTAAGATEGWFGEKKHKQTPQEQEATRLIQMRDQLQGGVLPTGGAPFGGKATTNLKTDAANLSRSIYPGKRK